MKNLPVAPYCKLKSEAPIQRCPPHCNMHMQTLTRVTSGTVDLPPQKRQAQPEEYVWSIRHGHLTQVPLEHTCPRLRVAQHVAYWGRENWATYAGLPYRHLKDGLVSSTCGDRILQEAFIHSHSSSHPNLQVLSLSGHERLQTGPFSPCGQPGGRPPAGPGGVGLRRPQLRPHRRGALRGALGHARRRGPALRGGQAGGRARGREKQRGEILWTKSTSHHLKIPGLMIPGKYQPTMVSYGFIVRISSIHGRKGGEMLGGKVVLRLCGKSALFQGWCTRPPSGALQGGGTKLQAALASWAHVNRHGNRTRHGKWRWKLRLVPALGPGTIKADLHIRAFA